ncbi:MAG: hypothetical protein QM783_01750 [Phycisphaerales bacterium]
MDARDACDIRLAPRSAEVALRLLSRADLLARLERWEDATGLLTKAEAAAQDVDPPDPKLLPRVRAARAAIDGHVAPQPDDD